ncbi:unnamed protein product [Penicillium bialowiezense]
MPRPHLSQDPHNQRRMSIMATMHEVIYCLRNTPHRLNDIVDMLNGVLRQLPSAISSSTRERDYEFEICARDLEDMIPRSLSLVQRSSSQEFRGIAENLIGCIPRSLQQPARWDPEVEEAASEAGSVARQHMTINTLSILPVEEMIDRLSAIKVVITIKLVIITMHMILTAPFTAKVIATADNKGGELRPNFASGYDSTSCSLNLSFVIFAHSQWNAPIKHPMKIKWKRQLVDCDILPQLTVF